MMIKIDIDLVKMERRLRRIERSLAWMKRLIEDKFPGEKFKAMLEVAEEQAKERCKVIKEVKK